jgi:hypothetical protein
MLNKKGLLARLLVVAVGLSASVGVAAEKSAKPTRAAQTSSRTATQSPVPEQKNRAVKQKAGVTKRASTPRNGRNPVRTADKTRRAASADADQQVAEEAVCYQRMAGRGRCEPQCLPYTRCRSGISSCRTGHENGPVTWFRCEQARGNASAEPADGRVLVLGRNAHGMPTGHTLYVEKAEPRGDGRYELILSHTNYDRRCNLEMNMLAEYDPSSRTIDVRSGKWEQWGRDLKVAGFIHN